MTNKIYELSDNDFIDLIKSSTCVKEVLFKLGYTTVGNSWGYSQVRNRMSILNLSSCDFKGRNNTFFKKEHLSYDKLFKEDCNHSRTFLRKTIIKNNLLDYRCAICGIDSWNGNKLSLELDHINGINNDNRLCNLRFLCPNCHSQTSTYGSKNIDSYNISNDVKDIIIESFKKYKTLRSIKKHTGISLSIIRHIINECGLNKHNLRFVIQYDKDMNEVNRFGSIRELCSYLMDNNLVKTKLYKTCRNTFLRNCNNFWLNSYWKILDA